MTSQALGIACVVTATMMWGVSPLYYAQMSHIPPFEIVVHRIIWSLPPIILYALLTGRRARFFETGRDKRKLAAMALSTTAISVNWFLFIYAIQIEQTAQASFGYYIYPLAVLILGVFVFQEGITRPQWVAAAIAAVGVVWIGMRFGSVPWISLIVMATFALYGTIRKAAQVGPMIGVLWELLLAAPVLLIYFVWIGGGFFFQSGTDALWLIGGSLFTGIPLILFVEATKRLRFATVGVLFYINPTLQFVSALILGEAFSVDRFIGFGFIWIAVILYCIELIRQDRAVRTASSAA
jgi:chloramphenicol-sensitive protein RarD